MLIKDSTNTFRECGRFFDCSTSHITEEDNRLLMNESWAQDTSSPDHTTFTIISYGYKGGFFIYVSASIPFVESLQEDMQKMGYSDNLYKLMLKAAELECTFLRLDADGMKYDDFERFNW